MAYNGGAFTAAVAGSPYTITPSAATGGTFAPGNYSINYLTGLLTVTRATTTGAVVSSANPALPGANVTFTLTVTPVAPGAGTPTGTGNFRINGSIGGAATLSGGVAAFATNSLPHGSNTVVVEYAGDPNFIGTTNSLAPAEVINTPPVAGNLTLQRNPNQGVKIRITDLLTNASDADHDALTLTVSPTSASNATVVVSGGWVMYATPAGLLMRIVHLHGLRRLWRQRHRDGYGGH